MVNGILNQNCPEKQVLDPQVTELIATLAGWKGRGLFGSVSDDSRINEMIAKNAHAFIVRIEKGATPDEAREAAAVWVAGLEARYGGAK